MEKIHFPPFGSFFAETWRPTFSQPVHNDAKQRYKEGKRNFLKIEMSFLPKRPAVQAGARYLDDTKVQQLD